jgi:hypothetical protein
MGPWYLGRARAADGRNPSFAFHLAWARRQKGDTQGAHSAWREAKELGWTIAACDPLERTFAEQLRRDLGQ